MSACMGSHDMFEDIGQRCGEVGGKARFPVPDKLGARVGEALYEAGTDFRVVDLEPQAAAAEGLFTEHDLDEVIRRVQLDVHGATGHDAGVLVSA
jgi:hypothetical protein